MEETTPASTLVHARNAARDSRMDSLEPPACRTGAGRRYALLHQLSGILFHQRRLGQCRPRNLAQRERFTRSHGLPGISSDDARSARQADSATAGGGHDPRLRANGEARLRRTVRAVRWIFASDSPGLALRAESALHSSVSAVTARGLLF